MIGKHIDLIAIGFLLLAIAVFTQARRVVVVQHFGPSRVLLVPQPPRPPVFLAPKLPRLSIYRG